MAHRGAPHRRELGRGRPLRLPAGPRNRSVRRRAGRPYAGAADMTEPPDAERDGRAERWRQAKPLLTRRLRGRRVGDVRVAPDLAARSRPAFAALLAAQALIAVGWIVAPRLGGAHGAWWSMRSGCWGTWRRGGGRARKRRRRRRMSPEAWGLRRYMPT